jgi:ABC-type transporter Mla subunit MlaD
MLSDNFANLITEIRNTAASTRLSVISDYEGKSRVVSIGTQTVQLLLKPYHDYLMKLLRQLEEDCS